MKKLIMVFVIVLLSGITYLYKTYAPDTKIISSVADVKNISYIIDGKVFTLVNGVAEKEIAPGSASKEIVRMFGEPVYGDLNKDGKNDAAIMLSSNSGGSGTFYYAVLAIATGTTYTSTNALLLGDRIAPQTVNIMDGRAVYNYAERKTGEPMATRPSIGKSLWIHINPKTGEIGEWVKDFEGEADVNKMSLGMKKWNWIKTQMNDNTVITPKKIGEFTLVFNKDGSLSVGTDCNKAGGKYTTDNNSIVFSQMISTMMYCDGSQESEFISKLGDVSSYKFTSKGELILEIKMDSGIMIFR